MLFAKIGARVLDLCLDMSSGPNWPKCSFEAPDPKVNFFIWDFMILLCSFHASGENEVLLVKIGARVLDLCSGQNKEKSTGRFFYYFEKMIVQQSLWSAGDLGSVVNPPAGPRQSPGGVWGKAPEIFWDFHCISSWKCAK